MARFSQESIERVKDAADIVEIVSAYTELRRSGQRFQGLCPFHDERTPSFSVNAGEKVYHCFGCGVGGDVITFVEEKEGLPFSEAVEALADRYGVEVEREQEDPRAEEARKRRARLVELLDRTAAFYATYLWESDEAAKSREYLLGRGLREEALREFGVGFAPNKWDTVYLRGQQAGFSVAEMVAAGLVKKGTKGGHLDHFRARIMFPIRDARGRMQGLGGRATRENQRAKYVNSPEGELYRKSRTLYGIERARPAIAKAGRAVVVEGYTDVIAAHQAGVGETVAVMGTAITEDQVNELSKYCEEIVLALDPDKAGRAAMIKAQRTALGRARLLVAQPDSSDDPADLLAKGGESGRQVFQDALSSAVDIAEFEVRALLFDEPITSPRERDRILDRVAEVLSGLTRDQNQRNELVRVAEHKLDLPNTYIVSQIQKAASTRPPEGSESADLPSSSQVVGIQEGRERAFLAMCLADPKLGSRYIARLDPPMIRTPRFARALEWVSARLEDPLVGVPRDDPEVTAAATELMKSAQEVPVTEHALEVSLLQLEKGAIEREIFERRGEVAVDLQKRRAELAERIAHHQTVTPRSHN